MEIFVLNKVRVWAPGTHLPTRASFEYPPGMTLPPGGGAHTIILQYYDDKLATKPPNHTNSLSDF